MAASDGCVTTGSLDALALSAAFLYVCDGVVMCLPGPHAESFWHMLCNELNQSLHVIVDVGQRTHCEEYWRLQNFVLSPYNPGVINASAPDVWDSLRRARVPLDNRLLLLYFIGSCHDPDLVLGKLFRYVYVYLDRRAVPIIDFNPLHSTSGRCMQAE